MIMNLSNTHYRVVTRHDLLRELFAPDVQRVEGIRAVGAVLQQVLLILLKLLTALVFPEAVAPSLHACSLHRQDQVIIVLAVEVRR